MSEIFVHDKQDQDKIKELFSAIDMEFDSDCDGFQVDGYIKFDEIIKVADYLRSQQDNGQAEYKNFCDRIKVGDTFLCHSDKCAFSGEVNHIDGRDVLIVIGDVVDPLPIILPAVEKQSVAKPLGNMQVGGDHYQQAIQPVEYIHANNLPFIEGNVVKYVTRHKLKDGAKDVEKAMSYCKMLLKMDYGYTDEQIKGLYGRDI